MENQSDYNQPLVRPQDRYWQRVRRITLYLLLTWLLVTFAMIFFARELSTFTFLGWPFSFYMAAQGTTLVYVGIVGIYAWRMERFDRMLKDENGNER